jgi:hypothetical protein
MGVAPASTHRSGAQARPGTLGRQERTQAEMATNAFRCVNPREIDADSLLLYARGEASHGAAQHIERCRHCQERAREYALLERGLLARLFRRSCPDTLTLGEYAMGLLDPGGMMTVAGHLVECHHCADESRDFARFLSEPDIPPAERGMFATIRRLVARPLTAPQPLLAGLRGGGDPESVTYAADGIHVIVSVQRAARGARSILAGMLQVGDVSPEGEARLFDGSTWISTEAIDDLGSFFFSGISPGTYRIELHLPDTIVELDPITVT